MSQYSDPEIYGNNLSPLQFPHNREQFFPIFFYNLLDTYVVRAVFFHQPPESFRMIHLEKMTHFMNGKIISAGFRQKHYKTVKA